MRCLLYTLLLLKCFSLFANDCVKTRAAFDIGSGTTKMKVAKVNICTSKILNILMEKNIQVPYKQSLKNSSDNKLSQSVMELGLKAIADLKREAYKFSPEIFVAVATSAFRTASNGKDFTKIIKLKTGILVKIISQKIEAKIGFSAATMIADKSINDIIVWDIGGGSMQITSYDRNQRFSIYEGQLASVTFKNYIIEKIQGKNVQTINSPNPILKEDLLLAMNFAEKSSNVDSLNLIKEKIKKGAQVLGIGGVHYYSIRKQLNFPVTKYTLKQLILALNKRSGMSDSEIGGQYAPTEVSNLALVAGFIKGLGIKLVKTGKINLSDGLLLAPEFAQ